MLTPTEESGIQQILEDFSNSDVFSLLFTVSKGLLSTTDRQAAISKILSCLDKPSDLLNRQKVTKKVLFSYLLRIKPVVSPECTKPELVKMCLAEWHSIEECQTNECENSQTYSTTTNNNTADVQQNVLSAMGVQFAHWFFSIYNGLQDFGPEHFWADCKLMAELKTAQDRKEASVVGANEVFSFLRSLIVMDKFYFDANTSQDSVTSEQDIHGLVRILVSGVVHQASNCIGLFDSFFGLVRNPAYNDNWKIKWIQMKIHVNSITSGNIAPIGHVPSICQTAMIA